MQFLLSQLGPQEKFVFLSKRPALIRLTLRRATAAKPLLVLLLHVGEFRVDALQRRTMPLIFGRRCLWRA
jgi:hypothetical protein